MLRLIRHFKIRTVLFEPLSVTVLFKFSSLLSNPSYINFANFIFASLMLHFINVTKRFSLSVSKFICFEFFSNSNLLDFRFLHLNKSVLHLRCLDPCRHILFSRLVLVSCLPTSRLWSLNLNFDIALLCFLLLTCRRYGAIQVTFSL